MTESEFWNLIEYTRDNNSPCDHHERIKKTLLEKTDKEIVDFGIHFMDAYESANTWSVRSIVDYIHDGCSEDGFIDFRGWLVAQGKCFYNECIKNPEVLFGRHQETMFYEEMPSIFVLAYEELTGNEFPDVSKVLKISASETRGVKLARQEIRERFSEILKKHNLR